MYQEVQKIRKKTINNFLRAKIITNHRKSIKSCLQYPLFYVSGGRQKNNIQGGNTFMGGENSIKM